MQAVDFKILPADFEATTVLIEAVSAKARESIGGGVSFSVKKSMLPSVVDHMNDCGLSWELV